jgi:isoleucyl-tRNA synthetase
MPWCPRCGVGISQMEMHEGYQLVAHRALFVAFPLRGRPNENLLVWTTTPWTLTSNVAAAVNPDLTYLKVRLRDQFYYLAKGAFKFQRLEEEFKGKKAWVEGVPKLKTLEQIFREKAGKEGFEIVGELSGAEMIGWEYDGPFDELPAQAHPSGYPAEVAAAARQQGWASEGPAKANHRVIAWKDVGETEGTGIVHIAPGCGAEDFELGRAEHLVAVAPLDETGIFLPDFGELAGRSALDHATTDWILANLKQKGVLLEVERYPHNYPHCWRCKTELLFRLVDEWFINMKWRDEIIEVTKQVSFLPESINGLAREIDWLRNMGDWMISKKRFWGLALPIWVCEQCAHFDVIGSRDELRQRAVAGWDRFEGHSPHRPWVDLVKIRCRQCGGTASRISDVGNPWLDAGIVPYSTVGYNRDRSYWEQWFPADLITECFPGQFRNWFYAILAMSTMMERRPPFKVLLGHGLVRDQKGEEMHKSKGNAIPFDGAVDTGYRLFHERDPKLNLQAQAQRDLPEGWLEGSLKEETVVLDNKPTLVVSAGYPPMGADEMRWLYCRHNPALNINFGPEPAEELRSRFLLKLWNTYAFFCNYARIDGFDPKAPPVPVKDRPDIDRWILSDLQLLIEKAHTAFRAYNVMAFCLETEKFVDDKLSNWYIRRNRRRFWKSEHGQDKLAAYQTLYTVLVTLTKLVAPVMPFLTEAMWQNLVGEASVHLSDFPTVDEKLIDAELSADMEALLRLVTLGSAARNTVKIKVRQPLAEMVVQPSDARDDQGQLRYRDQQAVARFADQIMEELNVKCVRLHNPDKGPLLRHQVKANPKNLGQKNLGRRLAEIQAALAATDPAALAAKLQAGEAFELNCPGGVVLLEPNDVFIQLQAPEGWAGVADRGTQVMICTTLTEALAREGMAREVVRHVQNARKDAGLEMEDRIILYLAAEAAALRAAIDAHRGYITAETLTAQSATTPLTGDGVYRANVKVDGQPLRIELRKA